jgi:hypothetical protein
MQQTRQREAVRIWEEKCGFFCAFHDMQRYHRFSVKHFFYQYGPNCAGKIEPPVLPRPPRWNLCCDSVFGDGDEVLMSLEDAEIGHATKKVLSLKSLSIRGRSKLLIRGRNGSGKTTLLRTIAGEVCFWKRFCQCFFLKKRRKDSASCRISQCKCASASRVLLAAGGRRAGKGGELGAAAHDGQQRWSGRAERARQAGAVWAALGLGRAVGGGLVGRTARASRLCHALRLAAARAAARRARNASRFAHRCAAGRVPDRLERRPRHDYARRISGRRLR